jgi:hypothetical protein
MQASPAEWLRDWHDFYILVGTASATLVGLMFVAASIGANVFNEGRAPLEAFLTPTVVHFSAALFACLIVVVPIDDWRVLAVLLGIGSIACLIYCGGVLAELVIRRTYKVDLTDRLFYALLPTLGYLLVLVAAALMFMRSQIGVDLMAAALLVLLLAGIRNAWDMTLWIVAKPSTQKPSESE